MLVVPGYIPGTADEANACEEKYKPDDTASGYQFYIMFAR